MALIFFWHIRMLTPLVAVRGMRAESCCFGARGALNSRIGAESQPLTVDGRVSLVADVRAWTGTGN